MERHTGCRVVGLEATILNIERERALCYRASKEDGMADLQTDLERGGLNWFDSGGTYDPSNRGPSGRDPWDDFPSRDQASGAIPVNFVTKLAGLVTIGLIGIGLFAPEYLLIFAR